MKVKYLTFLFFWLMQWATMRLSRADAHSVLRPLGGLVGPPADAVSGHVFAGGPVVHSHDPRTALVSSLPDFGPV